MQQQGLQVYYLFIHLLDTKRHGLCSRVKAITAGAFYPLEAWFSTKLQLRFQTLSIDAQLLGNSQKVCEMSLFPNNL